MSEPINIRQLREARGWTQGDMATYFGVDKATVWRWENKGVPARGPARQAIEREIGAMASENTQPVSDAAA